MEKPRPIAFDIKVAELRELVERQRTVEYVLVPELRLPTTPAQRAVLAVINCMEGIEIPNIVSSCSDVFNVRAIDFAISQLHRQELISTSTVIRGRAGGEASLTPKGKGIVETLQSKGKI